LEVRAEGPTLVAALTCAALRAAMAHLGAGRAVVADIDVERVTAGPTPGQVTDWLAAYISDGTGDLAEHHPLRPAVIRIPRRCGAAMARNLGVAVAEGETLVFADADMVLPPHALADVAARACDRIVLVGFRAHAA
jgi:hypothetical protein